MAKIKKELILTNEETDALVKAELVLEKYLKYQMQKKIILVKVSNIQIFLIRYIEIWKTVLYRIGRNAYFFYLKHLTNNRKYATMSRRARPLHAELLYHIALAFVNRKIAQIF